MPGCLFLPIPIVKYILFFIYSIVYTYADTLKIIEIYEYNVLTILAAFLRDDRIPRWITDGKLLPMYLFLEMTICTYIVNIIG